MGILAAATRPQVFTLPPSTASVWPVMKSLSAEARKTRGAQQVLGMLVALQRAGLDGAVPGGLDMARVLAHHRVAQGKARSQGVDPDAVPPQFARERPGERHHAALARDVVQHPGDAAIRGARADIDDLAIAAGDHVRGDVLHHQERPAQIDRHHLVPEIGVDLCALGLLQGREQRGVVYQHVDPAEALHGGGDQGLDRAFVADVGDGADHRIRSVLGGDLLRYLLAVGDIGDHDARAFGGERQRIVPADALGSAGDNGGTAGQSPHAAITSGPGGG